MNPDSALFTGLTRSAHALSNLLVIFGGVCLVIASAITGISIIGSLGWKPLPGEIEVVEALCGLGVFAFMPYCQLHRGHVGVDILINALGPKAGNISQLAGDVIIALLFSVLTWRHWIGTVDKFKNGETTTILELPIWWGYAVGFALMVATVLVSLYTIYRDVRDMRAGATIATPAGVH